MCVRAGVCIYERESIQSPIRARIHLQVKRSEVEYSHPNDFGLCCLRFLGSEERPPHGNKVKEKHNN